MESYEIENFWDDLLGFVEQRRVLPVVGAELLTIQHGGTTVPLYRAAGEKLLSRYRLSASALPGGSPRAYHELNDAVCAVVRARPNVRPNDLYRPVHGILQELAAEQKELLTPLCQLASIRDFELFATTTPDSLLLQALNATRFQGNSQTDEIVHAPKLPTERLRDIPSNPSSKYTALFYLFGKADVSAFYAIHDEDALEFAYTLQVNGPERMFSKLKGLNLLFIGCTFSDWLIPFFLRSSNSERLYSNRNKKEFLVGEEANRSQEFVVFLEHFSQDSLCYRIDPALFVDQLYQRWSKRNPAPSHGHDVPDAKSGEAIFISYSSDDIGAARKLNEDLNELGGDVVWFDKTTLMAGDEWELQIRSAIQRCTLFLPLISSNTESRTEAFFREEWGEAVERTRRIQGRKFILPIVIDPDFSGAMERYRLVPEQFKAFQYCHAPGGRMSEELRNELRTQLRALRKARAA